MLADSYQVADVLMLVGNVLPVALYFLILGLINSHARPYLITSRSDFLALTSVLLPVLIWPVPDFVRGGFYGPLAAGLLVAGAFFWYLLPCRDAGFVIYNITTTQVVQVLQQSLRNLGLAGSWRQHTWTADGLPLSIELRSFSLLQNVAVHVEARGDVAHALARRIGAQLECRLQSISQLPSHMG